MTVHIPGHYYFTCKSFISDQVFRPISTKIDIDPMLGNRLMLTTRWKRKSQLLHLATHNVPVITMVCFCSHITPKFPYISIYCEGWIAVAISREQDMLARRRRRRANIEPALAQSLVFARFPVNGNHPIYENQSIIIIYESEAPSMILMHIVGFTIILSTRVNEFRGFLSQFSTNCRNILQTYFLFKQRIP